MDVLHRVAFEPPKPEVLDQVAAVDPDLAALVAACLDKEQDRRPTAEAVIAAALTRQVPAPWPQGLSDAIMTCIQVTDTVAQLPLEPLRPLNAGAPASAPVEGTFVLGAHTPPPSGPPTPQGPHTPATVPAAADGRSAWSTPVQTAPLQAAPYQAAPGYPGAVHPGSVHPGAVQATPPTEAAGRFAPYVIQAPGPQPAPAAPGSAPQARPRRIGLLVTGAAVAVAAVAGLALLVAGPSSHASAAGAGTAGATATSSAGGSFQPGTAPSGSASAGSSATAARPSGSASAGSTATAGSTTSARSHHGGSPTAGASAAAPTQPGTGGTSTQSSAPTPVTTTATPVPPAQPAWIANCQYYSGSAETDPGSTDVAAVKEIQCILTYRGYNVVDGIDGQFGPNTKNAVEAFQRAKGLGVDGEVGPQTWPALRSSS